MPTPATLASSLARRVISRRGARYAHRDDLSRIDPDTDPQAYAQRIASYEFPWGNTQALSFALFRTYAVPSIGELLYRTKQFTEHTQKRYDDTALLLDAPVEHGFADTTGRAAIRRINQMHGMYDISNDDMLYVLATFVVCPVRWISDYEWRRLTDNEVIGLTNYYRTLGKHMAIKEIPHTYAEFERLLDEYERAHFAYSPGARAVADATLDLLGTFPPFRHLPRWAVRRVSYALMDPPLRAAFRYPTPTAAERVLVRAGLKARGLAIRWFARPRTEPLFVRDTPPVRGYPDGYRIAELGTFAPGCPVPHDIRDASGPTADVPPRVAGG
ncbi:oxygenase MpaB family protein [Gordonia sinesedis]